MLSYFFPIRRQSKIETSAHDAAASEEQLERSLEKLCRLPTAQPGQNPQPVPDDRVRRVVSLLLMLDNRHGRQDWSRWSDRPRTFIILWNIDAVHFMDEFVQKRYTDFYLPYDRRTLPGFLPGESLRSQFLVVQNQLLTSAKALEDLSNDSSSTRILPHVYLDGSGDEHFLSISTLGQGGFGAVDEVWSFLTLSKYARKRVVRGRQSSESNRRAQAYLVQELNDLKSLSHRHLVKVFGSYTDKDYIAFLMKPVADCNLHDFLRQSGGLKDQHRHDVRKFFGCLAGAVNYLHGCKIRHRDLSAKNILICQGAVYISDLGSAHKWTGTAAHGSMTQDRHVPMNIEYMAPEIAKRAARSSSSDMWSLGVVFLEMATLLVGRTLDQLQATIARQAGRHLEPYIWANPRVVSVWVNELQQSNRGPKHDNEPLVWIRDLLDEFPNNRPKSRGLMQDILECPSFSIFCCIECQPEFRDRNYQYAGLPTISGNTTDNSLNVQKDVASILRSDVRQPPALSTKKTSSIETWLARTDDVPDPWSSPVMPGSFDNALVDDLFEAPMAPDLETPDTITDTYVSTTEIPPPPPPPLPVFGLTGNDQYHLPDEPIELLADTDFYPYPPSIEPKKSSRIRDKRSFRAQDTGRGFLEYESSSSSDDGEPKLFNEVDDSSSSDTSSDATIHPPQDYGSGAEQTARQSCSVPLALPNFSGEDMSWIQTLDTLSEDVEEEQEPDRRPALSVTRKPEQLMSSIEEVFELDSHEVEGKRTEVPRNVASSHPSSCPSSAKPVRSSLRAAHTTDSEVSGLRDERASHHVKFDAASVLPEARQVQPGNIIARVPVVAARFVERISHTPAELPSYTFDDDEHPVLRTTQGPYASVSAVSRKDRLPDRHEKKSDVPEAAVMELSLPLHDAYKEAVPKDVSQKIFGSPSAKGVGFPLAPRLLHGTELPTERSEGDPHQPDIASSGVDNRQRHQEEWRPDWLFLQEPSNSIASPGSVHELPGSGDQLKNVTNTEAPAIKPNDRSTEQDPRNAPKNSSGRSKNLVSKAEAKPKPDRKIEHNPDRLPETSSSTAPGSIPNVKRPSKQRHDSVVTDDISTGNKVKTQTEREVLTKPRFKLQKAPTGFEGRGDKLSAANMASLNDSLPSPKRFEPKKREHEPGISASDYIQDTWEEASSVATSVMSERTQGILKGLSLNKWLDRDHGLLETFCAKGNVQAVRVLLDKGCNPGRADGSKQGRRIGPIVNAIQGASLKHNKCVRELISHGVDVNVVSRKTGKTPLHVAIENPYFRGYEHLIRHLIEAGANTNKADFKQDRPIMKIFYGNDTGPLDDYRRRALALLLRDAETEVDFVLPGTLNTPLHLAVRRKDPYAVGMLLFKKANVNAKNASGTTPLLLTANQFQGTLTKDHVTLLVLLLKTDGIAVDEKAGVNEQTALHYAIKAKAPVAVELLLTHGASPHCKDSEGRDALALAMQAAQGQVQDDHMEIMARLCTSMGKTWPRDEGGCVLEMACKEIDGGLMRILLSDGLEPNTTKNNRPILQRAIGYGNSTVVKLLTKNGAFADAENEKCQDAVTYAVQKREDELARYLCREGKYHRPGGRMTLQMLEMLIGARGASGAQSQST